MRTKTISAGSESEANVVKYDGIVDAYARAPIGTSDLILPVRAHPDTLGSRKGAVPS
jgi:hypothetical protein